MTHKTSRMDAPGFSNYGPRYNPGSQRQPQHDSYGRKVPIWEALSLDVMTDEKGGAEKQSSWRSWISKKSTSSAGSPGSSLYTENLTETPSWRSRVRNPMPWSRSNSAADGRHPSSPYTPVASNGSSREIHWKPYTLKLHVLGPIFVITLGLIASLEVLSHISSGNNGGGVTFAASVDDLSNMAIAAYLYLPTVIAVMYSMIWSWVDLDVKRLEPWFQLSRPQGAVAEESLLLQYPFDFLPFVPLRAARRRHWAVFIAGFTMVFITWAIVPLQSVIFTTGIVNRSRTSPMVVTGMLMPVVNQTMSMNSQFLNTAYGITWLDQKLPPYTTREYALLPFSPPSTSAETARSETWTAATQMYYSNLTCTPAIMTDGKPAGSKDRNGDDLLNWTFDDGNGCMEVDMVYQAASGDDRQAFRYEPAFLYNANCTGSRNEHKFLGYASNTVSKTSNVFTNLTALFCQPTYHVRNVVATINASTLAVVDVNYDVTSTPAAIGQDSFNVSNFEHMVGFGVSQVQRKGDVNLIAEIEHYPKLHERGIVWPSSSMMGYAIGLSSEAPAQLIDDVRLQQALERAQKLLFATVVNHLLIKTSDGTNPQAAEKVNDTSLGLIRDKPGGIILVRAFAIIVEVCLGMVGLLITALWLYSRRRSSSLVSDPGSISDVMKLVRSSQRLLHDFNDNGAITTEVLEERLAGHCFRLQTSDDNGIPTMQLQADRMGFTGLTAMPLRTKTEIDCPEQFQGVRPVEMKYITGVLITVVVAGATAALIILYKMILQNNGLRRPTNNETVLPILTNLVPTAFATLLEPFWVVLNRLLCVLQPFKDLRQGNATSRSTLTARYTSVPPQLAFWRALRAKHFLLAGVCAVAMSTNVLAVALSGLFEESPTTVMVPTTSKASLTPVLDGIPDFYENTVAGTRVPVLDHYYAALANVSGEAPLPPWVDQDYWFMPLELPRDALENSTASGSIVIGYKAATRGFGVDIDCVESTSNLDGDALTFQRVADSPPNLSEWTTEWTFQVTHDYPDGKNITCGQYKYGNKNSTEVFLDWWSEAAGAYEIVASMGLNNDTEGFNFAGRTGKFRMPFGDDGYCSRQFVAGWLRVSPGPANYTSEPKGGIAPRRNVTSAFMHCQPKLKTAVFDIAVDTSGRILSRNRTTEFDTDMELFGGEVAVGGLLGQVNMLNAFISDERYWKWHNDTATSNWFNTVLGRKLNTTRLSDPLAPLPNIPELIPHAQQVYRQVAALLLSYNAKSFKVPDEEITLPMFVITTETRIFMEPVMFFIAVSLLGIQLTTLLAYYLYRPRKFLPRMPLTIASIIAYVSASHATQNADLISKVENKRYAYGRFRGVDGKTHVGIEEASLVVPLEVENPMFKRRRRSLWLGRKPDPMQPRIWI